MTHGPRNRVRNTCVAFTAATLWLLPSRLAPPAATLGSSAAASGSPGPEAGPDSQAVLARRRAALDTLQKILGRTANRSAGGQFGPPVFFGYIASFLGFFGSGARINVTDKTWEAWQQRTGELPPDFAALPSEPEIPDPLMLVEQGRRSRITTSAQWEKQRARIREQFEHWVFGKSPPAPTNLRAVVTGTRREGDVEVRDVRLEFGPDHKATLRLQLLIPPGKGPFPVFLTDHPRVRPWVNIAARRGYLGCIYYAADASYVGRDDSNAWMDIYPEADWSLLARWAWGASRAVDYLETLPIVEKNHIAISGHSRNSKQALLAAALDERIGAVVPSRGNAGDALPFRYNTYPFMSEPLEEITDGLPNYFHPRLRFFVGREDKLPVDMNLLQALVAPRGLLLSHAYTEHQANVFAVEQSYRSVKSVYQFLGHPDRLGLYQQPGEHPASAEDLEVYFDFFDTVFGRGHHRTPEIWVHGYSFDQWRKLSGEVLNPLSFPKRTTGDFLGTAASPITSAAGWQQRRAAILEQLRWALGVEPPQVPFPNSGNLGSPTWWTSEGFLGDLVQRRTSGMPASDLAFGDALRGEFYIPEGKTYTRGVEPKEKWPVVIWLHPYSYGTGYSRYAFWAPLIRSGFGVFAFDQIGFGARNGQALSFYERYPHWSLLGKMVADTRAAISAVRALQVADTSRIYLVGFGLGAQVALLTAALDERVTGIAVGAGFAPLRLDPSGKRTEGVRHYSHLHGLIPRFGFFAGNEDRLPIDFDEILAAIAPRPVFTIAPLMDRYYPVDDVRSAIAAAGRVYQLFGQESALQLVTPLEFSRFPNVVQKPAYDWLALKAGLASAAPKDGGH